MTDQIETTTTPDTKALRPLRHKISRRAAKLIGTLAGEPDITQAEQVRRLTTAKELIDSMNELVDQALEVAATRDFAAYKEAKASDLTDDDDDDDDDDLPF